MKPSRVWTEPNRAPNMNKKNSKTIDAFKKASQEAGGSRFA